MAALKTTPIELVDVREIAVEAERVVASFGRDYDDLLAGAEVHHIGATSLPFGHMKGDVDVNVRVEEAHFASLVGALRERLAVAQPENRTTAFASFSADGYSLPLGVQVTVIGSDSDFLLRLRDHMRANPEALERYDELKLATASDGPEAYWQAKDRLLRELLAES